jgi:hypothetical protein
MQGLSIQGSHGGGLKSSHNKASLKACRHKTQMRSLQLFDDEEKRIDETSPEIAPRKQGINPQWVVVNWRRLLVIIFILCCAPKVAKASKEAVIS